MQLMPYDERSGSRLDKDIVEKLPAHTANQITGMPRIPRAHLPTEISEKKLIMS